MKLAPILVALTLCSSPVLSYTPPTEEEIIRAQTNNTEYSPLEVHNTFHSMGIAIGICPIKTKDLQQFVICERNTKRVLTRAGSKGLPVSRCLYLTSNFKVKEGYWYDVMGNGVNCYDALGW